MWRGDGHITLGDGSVIDIGVVYGWAAAFSRDAPTPNGGPGYMVFADGYTYTFNDLYAH